MPAVSALDVAKYLLNKNDNAITAMKLQKLVYYSQAWTLAWSGQPLFTQETQAWANGPVVRELFVHHRGKYTISSAQLSAGDPDKLSSTQRDYIDAVFDAYSTMSAAQLSLLTHAEDPWKLARTGVQDGANSTAVISKSSMKDFYRTLAASPEAVSTIGEVNFPSWA